jgi:predicted dehydrogenase
MEFCSRAVREGLLGNIFELHGIMGKVVDPAERKTIAASSGGVMFELGCHLIDAMVGLLGKPQAVESHLRTLNRGQDSLADNALAVFEYPQALATIRSCAMDVEGFSRRTLVVCGDQGAITILPLESGKLTLALARAKESFKKGSQPIELRKSPGRYDDQLADFAGMIRGEKEVDVTPEHDLAVLETVLRASGMPTDA